MTTVPLRVDFALGSALEPVLAHADAAGGAGRMVERLLARLGLPTEVAVQLVQGSDARPLAIQIAGSPVAVSSSALRLAWAATAPAHLRAASFRRGGEPGYPSAWLTQVAEATPPDALTAFVIEAARVSLVRQPCCLVQDAGGGMPPDPESVLLRELVSLGISIGDRAALRADLRAAEGAGWSLRETIENLVARRRDPIVRIEIAAEDAAVYGLDAARRDRQPVGTDPQSLDSAILGLLARELEEDAGFLLPPMEWAIDPDMPPGLHAVGINSLTGPRRPGLGQGELLVWGSMDELDGLGVPYRERPDLTQGMSGVVVDEEHWATVATTSLTMLDARAFALFGARRDIDRYAYRLLDLDEAEARLGLVIASSPLLVQHALERYGPAEIAAILRCLLRDRVPIANVPRVLAQLLEMPALEDTDPEAIADRLRPSLAGEITHRYAELAHDRVLHVLRADEDLEREAVTLATQDPSDVDVARRIEALRDAMWTAVGGEDLDPPVLLSSPGRRRPLRTVFAPEMTALFVMDERELEPRTAVPIAEEPFSQSPA